MTPDTYDRKRSPDRALLGDDEVAHHGHVLVFEVVAVEDVASSVAVKAGSNGDLLPGEEIDRVLPADVVRAGPAATSRQHLERV